eukprot:TRINITY_DN3809_c0_g1_i1.p1 TRINITY_DN3809_c0_g1~~TRINITY_DN3809_c0_g1_i1.p1  ORF type:complete len:106 (+),score=18.58 TRINITY_DN3809_c0_g1_i1:51-368(+)
MGGQKNSKKRDFVKWLDIKGWDLSSQCSKFLNFIMCEQISCIVQLCALRRVHCDAETLEESAAEAFEFEKAIEILSKLIPPPDVHEKLKDFVMTRKRRSKSNGSS